MINMRQVEAFRAVMLTGGMTPAAELMNVTQPAVSRLIHDLQARLGLKLFERRGTRLVPTGEAHSLYREVERSFIGIDRIQQAAVELRERRAGTLRIASLPALANSYLPRFVGRFIATRPKLDLALFGLPTRSVLDWVATGQCDVGFAELPVEHSTVMVEPLPTVAAIAVVPARHRLAKRRRLQPRDFDGEPFVSLGQSTLLRFRIDAVFADAGVRRQMRIETPLSMIACSFAAAGSGLTIVSPFDAEAFHGRDIVVLPFEPRIDVEFGVLYSTQQGLSGVARDLIDAFQAEVEAFARRRG
jgi:DNA-binding transcriptional LysR family regulator